MSSPTTINMYAMNFEILFNIVYQATQRLAGFTLKVAGTLCGLLVARRLLQHLEEGQGKSNHGSPTNQLHA